MAAGGVIAGLVLIASCVWATFTWPGVQNIADPTLQAVAQSFSRLVMGISAAGLVLVLSGGVTRR